MIKIQTTVSINNAFRELIKSHRYEYYVYIIINRSRIIFCDNHFYRVPDQSHGESDFIDNNNQLYDAKLLFNNKQGALIGEAKNDLILWINDMLNEKIEFSRCLSNRRLSFIPQTKLYSIMRERIESVKENEHVILFIPFPIVDEFRDSVFLQFATDFLQAVYNKLLEDGIIKKRRVFFIYPSGNPHEYVLRDEQFHREYIQCNELDDFISYKTIPLIDFN